jgi:hypothetical protein
VLGDEGLDWASRPCQEAVAANNANTIVLLVLMWGDAGCCGNGLADGLWHEGIRRKPGSPL